jgi:hypothetical protein
MNDGLQPYNRRTVLRALAGVAGLPFVSFAEAPKRKVGIVGGGMAGVSLAWLLGRQTRCCAAGIRAGYRRQRSERSH